MKKIIIFTVCLALFVSLASCAKNEEAKKPGEVVQMNETDNNITSDDTESGKQSKSTIVFDDGRAVELGASADGVLAALGEYLDVYEAPSCVHEGSDRFYTYDGFSVTTSPSGEGDTVTELLIETSGCTLANGITVGSSVDEVIAAYGEDYTESFGAMKYSLEGVNITVVTDGECVTSVLFTLE